MTTASLHASPFGHRHAAAFGNRTGRHRMRANAPQFAGSAARMGRELNRAADVAATDWRGVMTVYLSAFAGTLAYIV